MLLALVQELFPNDTGPIYKETIAGRFPVEPFNTYSNLIFLFIVIYFGIRIYKEPKNQWFLMITIPFMLIDWVPIRGLSFAAILYFVFKWKDTWRKRLIFITAIGIAFVGLRYLPVNENLEHNLGYLISALTILIPIIGYLAKTKWRNVRPAIIAFIIFGVAVAFRVLDTRLDFEIFWMGTHWLWHLFGGTAVFFILLYIFRDNKAQAAYIS